METLENNNTTHVDESKVEEVQKKIGKQLERLEQAKELYKILMPAMELKYEEKIEEANAKHLELEQKFMEKITE